MYQHTNEFFIIRTNLFFLPLIIMQIILFRSSFSIVLLMVLLVLAVVAGIIVYR